MSDALVQCVGAPRIDFVNENIVIKTKNIALANRLVRIAVIVLNLDGVAVVIPCGVGIYIVEIFCTEKVVHSLIMVGLIVGVIDAKRQRRILAEAQPCI